MKYFMTQKESIPGHTNWSETMVLAGNLYTEEAFIKEMSEAWHTCRNKSVEQMVIFVNMETEYLVLMIPD